MTNLKSLIIMAAILMALMLACHGQILKLGTCPGSVDPHPYLEFREFLGTWYEYMKHPNAQNFSERFDKCVSFEYSLIRDNTIYVNKTETNDGDQKRVIPSIAKMVKPGIFNLEFPGAPFLDDLNFWVLDTDYLQYATVYNCVHYALASPPLSIISVWLLTRKRQPNEDTILLAMEDLQWHELPTEQLVRTFQGDCE